VPGDPDWDGVLAQPYHAGAVFNQFFTPYQPFNNATMLDMVRRGGGSPAARAARDVVAAYLNSARFGAAFPYSGAQIAAMWADAVSNGTFQELHTLLGPINEGLCPAPGLTALPVKQ
jgi:hypothetical protein